MNRAEHFWLFWDDIEKRTAVSINPVHGGTHVVTTNKRRRIKRPKSLAKARGQ
jgi:hypothetical protein